MAERWQEFELDCFSYVNSKYGQKANFTALGQSDSTVADIHVCPSNGRSFFIETKSSSAQCGQFVLIVNSEKHCFDYSPRNQTPFFRSTQTIMDYMNHSFERFANATTSGTDIYLPKDIFYDWIKDYYSSKNVKFFITKSQTFLIFPIRNFDKYFDVTACYRIKKSGSASPSASNIPEIKRVLKANGIDGEINAIGKDYFLHSSEMLDGVKLVGERYSYLFRSHTNSTYLIRKLSNTNNANVIFQIKLKNFTQSPSDLLEFESSL